MKIYDRNLMGTAASDASRPSEAQKSEGSRSAGSVSSRTGDRVELSGGLGALSRAVSADHLARMQRIHALSAQVNAGEYHPDAMAISRGMIQDAVSAQ